jgi:hypothetical protein
MRNAVCIDDFEGAEWFVDKRTQSLSPAFAPQTIHKRHTSFQAGWRRANPLTYKVFCLSYRKTRPSY